jgi:hypothetical protein
MFIGIRILTRVFRNHSRDRLPFSEYDRPTLPVDDRSSGTHYPLGHEPKPETPNESTIFRLADEMKGRLTVSDIVIATDLGLKEAERVIEAMVDGIHVTMEVTESGRMIYEFPEIIAKYERGNPPG